MGIIWDQALALFSVKHKAGFPTVQTIQTQCGSFSVFPARCSRLPAPTRLGSTKSQSAVGSSPVQPVPCVSPGTATPHSGHDPAPAGAETPPEPALHSPSPKNVPPNPHRELLLRGGTCAPAQPSSVTLVKSTELCKEPA